MPVYFSTKAISPADKEKVQDLISVMSGQSIPQQPGHRFQAKIETNPAAQQTSAATSASTSKLIKPEAESVAAATLDATADSAAKQMTQRKCSPHPQLS